MVCYCSKLRTLRKRERLVRRHPEIPQDLMSQAHYARGEILYQQHNFTQAEKEFRQHLVTEPDDPAGHIMLAAALIAQA
ncbi:MAG: tetratricopeptide repeat protein, partial [Cyanobacteria bacterium]|nr:tetratricopeptide repeat protein [Cyanobacteriota bacterium]